MVLLQRKSLKNLFMLCCIFHEIFAFPQSEICLTKGCITAASRVIDSMDTTVDPCDNFYNFACGNFIKQSNLLDKDANVIMENMQEKSVEQLRVIVSEPENPNDTDPFRLVKKFYSQCMDGKSGISSFLEIVDRFGGLPLLKGENWNENQFDFEGLLSEIQKYEYDNYLFYWSVFYGRKIQLRRAISRQYLFSYTKKNRAFMINFINLFESSTNKDNAQELEEVFNFQNLLEILDSVVDPVTNSMTLQEFQTENTYLNWTNFISEKMHADLADFTVEFQPEYFKKFGELIGSTPSRTLANYLILNFAISSAKYLSKDMSHLSAQYISPNQIEERWKFCLLEVQNNLKYPLSAMYINKHFDMNTKRNIKEMIKSIRTEAIRTFEAADWMSQSTQVELLQKLKNLEFKYVGFLNELMDSVKMKKNYENFNLPENFFLSNLEFKHHKDSEEYSEDLTELLISPPFQVDAFYTPYTNSITFPAAFLHSPFYESNRPQYMNYGAIGWAIGHEISHMFDDGRKYLGDDRVNCLIDQYSSYIEPSINKTLNGAKTIKDDLADNIGVKMAYKTYKKYIDLVGEELQLPGLNYSQEQLFWIAGAQQWCSRYGVGTTKNLIMDEVHTLPQFRVFGTYRNMVEFSEDWQCSKNSKMNPAKRCEIWK